MFTSVTTGSNLTRLAALLCLRPMEVLASATPPACDWLAGVVVGTLLLELVARGGACCSGT